MPATLLCESAKTVVNMNFLILVLFVGATVALAEIHVGNDSPHRTSDPALVDLNSFLYMCFTNLYP